MYIDLLFLIFIIFFSIVGYMRGFLNQLLSILLIFTILLFAKPLADWLKFDSGWAWFQKSPLLVLWAMSAFFFFVAFIGMSALIQVLKKSPGLMPVDRWVGVGFGALKGFFLMLFLGAIYLTLPEGSRAQFADVDRDSRQSLFLKMSGGLMEWEALASFRSLQQIQQKLEPEEVQMGRDLFEESEKKLTSPIKEMVKPTTTKRPVPWQATDKQDSEN